jgi:hypothetical protein
MEHGLRDLHYQMCTLGRVYANDDSTLEAFLESVWKQLLTQSAQFHTFQPGKRIAQRHSSARRWHLSAASSPGRRR